MKKFFVIVGVIIILMILLIPIKKNIPSKYLCQCYYYSHKIYKALLYTYVEKYTYKTTENNDLIPDETIKKIFWWPINNWERINNFLVSS